MFRLKSAAFALMLAGLTVGAAQAQGVVRGAQDGERTGRDIAGPVGGAAGTVVGGAVGGATGAVKGVLGIPQDTRVRRSQRQRRAVTHRRHRQR